MEDVIKQVKSIEGRIISHRRQIHSNPELSFNEFQTCNYICKVLSEIGVSYEVIGNTGVVATLFNPDKDEFDKNRFDKDRICIAFRADIDALPIKEETGCEFASKNIGVMHACGHDLHAAMLLGAAEILQKNIEKLNGIVKLIFQPAEEVLPGGAKIMIENGVLENPKPKFIFAQHINPELNCGFFEAASAHSMASTCEIFWKIKGKGSHAGQPHLGKDPITAAANIINFCQTFLVRNKNPFEPAVLSICSINGGTANNIFPDEVNMSGTLRAFNENLRNELLKNLVGGCEQIAKAFDTECEININYGYPALINNEIAFEKVKKSVERIFGQEKFLRCEPKMWAEDFSYFSSEIPSCFYFIGVKNPQETSFFPLHNSKLNPDENALVFGTSLICEIANQILG